MDIAGIGQLIGSVGFPIVCCIVLFYQNRDFQKTLEKLSVTLTDITNQIKSLNERMTDIDRELDGK